MIVPFAVRTYSVGAWALSYLVNGDSSDLTDKEETQIDEWLQSNTQTWRDADDNKWVYSHESVKTESHDEFGVDAITGLRGPVYEVEFLFRLEANNVR